MLVYSWLAALCVLPQQPAAPPADPVRISKTQFLAGRKPAQPALPKQGYTTGISGVKVGGCPLLKSRYADTDYLKYTALGTFQAAPTLFFARATEYNGYAVVALDASSCRRYALTGTPLLSGNCLVCFNDQETTDLQDTLSVWRLTTAGQLVLRKKIPLPKSQLHYDPSQVRFSLDGRRLYYLNVARQYVAVELGN